MYCIVCASLRGGGSLPDVWTRHSEVSLDAKGLNQCSKGATPPTIYRTADWMRGTFSVVCGGVMLILRSHIPHLKSCWRTTPHHAPPRLKPRRYRAFPHTRSTTGVWGHWELGGGRLVIGRESVNRGIASGLRNGKPESVSRGSESNCQGLRTSQPSVLVSFVSRWIPLKCWPKASSAALSCISIPETTTTYLAGVAIFISSSFPAACCFLFVLSYSHYH